MTKITRYNAFGHSIYRLPEIIANERVRRLARDILLYEANVVGATPSIETIESFLSFIGTMEEFVEVPERARKLAYEIFGGEAGLAKIRDFRVRDILQTLRPALSEYPVAGFVLDVGCGTGLVAHQLIGGAARVQFADVVDYRDETLRGAPITLIPTSGLLPFPSRSFDAVLLITVLHHAENPQLLLQEAARIARHRVYILESLVAVSPIEHQRQQRSAALRRFSEVFVEMTVAEQMMHASLQDWIYNDVVQGGVAVPMNFSSHRQWMELFKSLGLEPVYVKLEGYDERTAPEYHVTYVCEVPDA